jgi:hypothetical protein
MLASVLLSCIISSTAGDGVSSAHADEGGPIRLTDCSIPSRRVSVPLRIPCESTGLSLERTLSLLTKHLLIHLVLELEVALVKVHLLRLAPAPVAVNVVAIASGYGTGLVEEAGVVNLLLSDPAVVLILGVHPTVFSILVVAREAVQELDLVPFVVNLDLGPA